eukprot:sb/3473547/
MPWEVSLVSEAGKARWNSHARLVTNFLNNRLGYIAALEKMETEKTEDGKFSFDSPTRCQGVDAFSRPCCSLQPAKLDMTDDPGHHLEEATESLLNMRDEESVTGNPSPPLLPIHLPEKEKEKNPKIKMSKMEMTMEVMTATHPVTFAPC